VGSGWVRPAAGVLAVLMAVASGLDLLLEDDRLLEHTRLLWPMTSALLVASTVSTRPGQVAGPSPWTPVLLRVLAVIVGSAGGILVFVAGQSRSTEDDTAVAVLALSLLALVLVGIVIVVAVLVGAASRGLPWRASMVPWLSAADRRRARDTAAAPVALYCAAVLLAPWLPAGPPLWVPIAVAFALGCVLWGWRVTRPASTRD
jgi:hypothetical protein